ncbi:hypothetical protein [Prochlorothrix hollandica]|uniref:hypothetical protein n=1 Tax=Prochlorothrix hollandica TaxID=1223 RepID=UPI00333E3169
MAGLMDNLKKLFNADANPDPIIAPLPPEVQPPAATVAIAAPVAVPAAATPGSTSAPVTNSGTPFANDHYAVINFQYGEEDKNWPKKIGVYKKGVGICWYQAVEAP